MDNFDFGAINKVDISAEDIFSTIDDRDILFRWGYRNRSIENAAIATEIANVKSDIISKGLNPYFIYSVFRCRADNNSIVIFDKDGTESQSLVFQRNKQGRAVSDYFKKSTDTAVDTIPMAIATLGTKAQEILEGLSKDNKLVEYYMYHIVFSEMLLTILNKATVEFQNIFSAQHATKYISGRSELSDDKFNSVICQLLKAKDYDIDILNNIYLEPKYTRLMLASCNKDSLNYYI